MTKPVVTRFAPSPTGYLHIGGARTALFNWLYAKHTGGKFLLRIEDTDRARSTDAATAAILDGLKWLGLEWDGDALFQFARADRHREVAKQLLAEGKAYNCYLSAAELDEMRQAIEAERAQAREEKRSPRGAQTIQSPWRDRDPKEAPAGVAPAIRLRAAKDGETVIEDMVAGRVVVKNTQLDDMIIVRSDGAPTYNFAVVVDDHDMGVTHVIRGADHLNNASRQTQVYLACGWDVPVWAHVPLIHGADGAKLSKRHGAQGVEEYRAMGYLPVALRNYLVRLGWSHGNDEIISPEQMIEWFDIDDLGKSAARFDFAKLADLNGHYIRKAEPAEIKRRLAKALPEMKPDLTTDKKEVPVDGPAIKAGLDMIGWDKLDPLLPALMERAKTLKDIAAGTGLLFSTRPLALDEKAAKVIDDGARATLQELAAAFAAAPEWKPAALEAILKAYVETSGKKMGQVAQPLRVALTGTTVSPPVFDIMAAFGREESLARITDQAA